MSVAPPTNTNQTPGRTPPGPTPAPTQNDPWAVRIATVAGIPIRLHFTFLLFLLWIGFSGRHGFSVLSILFVVTIFACVVLHELGHSLVSQRFGIPVGSITLYPIGGVALIEKRPKPRQEFWIAVAGPAVNVVIAAILWGALTAQGRAVDIAHLAGFGRVGPTGFAEGILRLNIMLVLFNLIPAFPMDGGRVLRAVLAMNMPPAQATRIAAGVGQFIAVAAGLLALISGQFWYLLIAFFVYTGAGQEAGASQQAALMEGVHVREAMISDVRTLSVGHTLKEAADILLDTSQHDFPVLHGDAVQGLLTRNDLLRGLAEQGPGGYVAGTMNRRFVSAGPDDDLAETLPHLQATPGPLLVLDGDRLLGIVTGENVAEFFAIRQIAAARNGGQAGR